jgi:DNA (cytosine-5)-methyltransferase 1
MERIGNKEKLKRVALGESFMSRRGHGVPIQTLSTAKGEGMRSVELFSGCGGLAMGLSRVGFDHQLMVEWNSCAVATVRHNRARGVAHVAHWPIERLDVRAVDWSRYHGMELVAGGPPCQPFSIGGKHRGDADARDMWPQAMRAVREIRPEAFLFENVRGLMRPKFRPYLNAIVAGLANPDRDLRYRTHVQQVNAADFGAPQKRHRVIIAGLRGGRPPERLEPTHSRARLLWDQWVTGEYWHRHGLQMDLDAFPKADATEVCRLRNLGVPPTFEPWVTVRDALAGLGAPNGLDNHVFQAGARVYKGHTGSPLDQPAKALKAGDHGVPGGENMMVMDDGLVRYFTIREAARLQGLPDEFSFPTSWSESMRQLGNAVPVQLAEAAGGWLRGHLGRNTVRAAAAA